MGKTKYLFFALFTFGLILLGTQKVLAAATDRIIINEVMANAPTPESDLEWVELYNTGSNTEDLKNWTFDGKVISPTSILIDAQDYLILARNADAFKIHWPDVTTQIVQVSMTLTNGSDTVVLQNSDASFREEFSWASDTSDSISWERIDPLVTSNDNWFPSLVAGGTPGKENSVFGLSPPLSPTLLKPENDAEFTNAESIEFTWQVQNEVKYEFILSKTADLTDYLYDELNLSTGKYVAEDLEPGTYFWQVIASNGLYETPSAIFSFEILEPTYSDAIIINELYPDPENGEEWIELYNNSAEDVNLKDWILEDLKGSLHQYKITDDLIIPPYGYITIPKSQSGITLNNDQDGVRLIRPDSRVICETPIFSAGENGWSFARNSSGVWEWTTKQTPGGLNTIIMPIEEDDEEEDIPKNSTPIEIKTGDVKNYENYLVKIKGIVVETSGNTFYIDDGTGKVKVYIQAASGIDKPEMHKGDIFEIEGIVNVYRGVWRILPQKQEDIKLVQAKEEDEASLESKVKVAAVKSSTASKSTSTKTVAKARAPKAQAASNNKNNLGSSAQVEGYQSPFWVELIKAITGLAVVFLIILIVKLWKIKKDNPSVGGPLGGNFGDDFT